MRFMLALACGVVGAILGYVVGQFVTPVVWPDAEPGMTGLLITGPLGFFVGLLAGWSLGARNQVEVPPPPP